MLDISALETAVAAHGTLVRVVLADVKGSTPREAGTAMLVWANGQSGTIGGGSLEMSATRTAREMLDDGKPCQTRRVPLGPGLGQCCGGSVTLVFETFNADSITRLRDEAETGVWMRPVSQSAGPKPARILHQPDTAVLDGNWFSEPTKSPLRPVCIYGAGHVGRALAPVLDRMPDLSVTVFDTRSTQAELMERGITCITSLPWDQAATSAPPHALHYIMTPDHDVDLHLCHLLLTRSDARFIGLIGSATKWARFRSRLSHMGHSDDQIARITCPIGDPSLGKQPESIAIGVAAALLKDITGETAGGQD